MCLSKGSDLKRRLVEDPGIFDTNDLQVYMTNGNTDHANKRRRLSPPSSQSSSLPSRSSKAMSDTPPSSIPPETRCLKIAIPSKEPSEDERRKLAIRRAAARRWESKLERPFPTPREVRDAYDLKLMRHYKCAAETPEPGFIKPSIDKSPRVTGLLRQFPKLATSPVLQTQDSGPTAELDTLRLQVNKDITQSESVQRLAWQSFSTLDRDGRHWAREAMMESGLVPDELTKESQGHKNALPQWKKWQTGKFAAGLQDEQDRG
jgi:hypothetical protein